MGFLRFVFDWLVNVVLFLVGFALVGTGLFGIGLPDGMVVIGLGVLCWLYEMYRRTKR